jgi:hypothetical protein
MSRQLDKPMSDESFQQLVLLSNSIAVFQMAIKMEKQGSPRRREYGDILMRLRRVERTIPGNLDGRVIDASAAFYARLEEAVARFRDSFKDARLVGRDKKGRFVKL